MAANSSMRCGPQSVATRCTGFPRRGSPCPRSGAAAAARIRQQGHGMVAACRGQLTSRPARLLQERVAAFRALCWTRVPRRLQTARGARRRGQHVPGEPSDPQSMAGTDLCTHGEHVPVGEYGPASFGRVFGEYPNPWGAVPDDVSLAAQMKDLGVNDPVTASSFYTRKVVASITSAPAFYLSEVVRRVPKVLIPKTDWGLALLNA